MVGMNATISRNVLELLRVNGKKQNDLAAVLGVSKQVMSNMLNGSRMINAVELRQIAEYFNVSMEKLMESPKNAENINVVHAFMGEVKSPAAKQSLKFVDELADMVIYYARIRDGAEELEETWEA